MDQLELGRLLFVEEVISGFLILWEGVMMLDVGCYVSIDEMG